MHVEGYDPAIPIQYAWRLSRQVRYNESLEELLPKCDYLTVHVPLLDSTRGMIGEEPLDERCHLAQFCQGCHLR